jgi:hypothetical protein
VGLKTDATGKQRGAAAIFYNVPAAVVDDLLASMDPEVASHIRELRRRFNMKESP